MTQQNNNNYDENDIQVLEGLEAVRKRPGMYIGSTGPSGLHHLVYEIVDNSIDEALAGYCTEITVEILPGDVIRVSDNGRGIPVGIHPKEGISAATVVYTILHAGGKFGGGGYKVSGGLHGVGASVVNALSEWLELTVKDGEHVYFQKFNRGNYDEQLKIIGDTTETGTSVMFKADGEIFEHTVYDYETLLKRLREQAFLNAGIKIVFSDKRDPNEIKGETLHYEGGIRQFVEHILREVRRVAVAYAHFAVACRDSLCLLVYSVLHEAAEEHENEKNEHYAHEHLRCQEFGKLFLQKVNELHSQSPPFQKLPQG